MGIEVIPKIIHYCWFGYKDKSNLAKKCIESWHKYCPDFIFKEWNESNFDINSNVYVLQAYKAKKWAFITDYVRLYALVNEGGIYMDIDVELIKPIYPYLTLSAFSGFQTDTEIPTGIMGSIKGFHLFRELLSEYEDKKFKVGLMKYDMTPNVVDITNKCIKKGLVLNNCKQNIEDFVLFPKDHFCAKDYNTGKITITNNTVSIHHFSATWLPKEILISRSIDRYLSKKSYIMTKICKIILFPLNFIGFCKMQGFVTAFSTYYKKCNRK